MRPLLLLYCLLATISLQAQPFAIGKTRLTPTDPARSSRAVPMEVYYPAAAAGNDVPCIGSGHPVISVGHGFLMAVSAFENISNALVPLGYVVALVDTEGSASPNHAEFGRDLAFAITALRGYGNTPSSVLYNKIGNTSAIMGHSMGGGATLLAMENNTSVTCFAGLAPANTNPSAIAAAANVTAPGLIFSGSSDCVTPPAGHQIPMYDALPSTCKVRIEINGASHCKFANDNFICGLGELTCPGTLNRTTQHNIVFRYLIPFFNYYLKGQTSEWAVFINTLPTDPDLTTYQYSCTNTISTGIPATSVPAADFSIQPNPVADILTLQCNQQQASHIIVRTITGAIVHEENLPAQLQYHIPVSAWPAGYYWLTRITVQGTFTQPFIK